METLDELRSLFDGILESEDVEIIGMHWERLGQDRILQVEIDAPGGVDLDLCATIASKLSDALDAQGDLRSEIALDVCSAGAERPLVSPDAIRKAVGRYVHVALLRPYLKQTAWEGVLKEVLPEAYVLSVRIKQATKIITIKKEDVAGMRLAVRL